MKSIFLKSLSVAAIAVCAVSCNNNSDNKSADGTMKDTTTNATVSTDVKMGTDTATMQSQTTNNGGMATTENEFVTKVAGGGMMEVESGKVAQANAASADIKAFGKMMVDDHTKAGDELKSIAAADNINFPTTLPAEHQGHIDMLKAKTGVDFDKEYIKMMVDDHGKTVEAFKKAAKDNPDAKVKAFAAKTLPTIEAHWAKAKALQAKMK